MKLYIFSLALASAIPHSLAEETMSIGQTQFKNQTKGARPDAHAPIGVMADHVHAAGEFMFSYRFMNMHMEDLYRGSDTISNTLASSGYMMTPLEMDMDMHMLGLMYAPTDHLTLMAMFHYLETSMSMANGMGEKAMEMKTSGLGDSSLTALYQFYNNTTTNTNAHFGLGLSIPTGNNTKKVANAPMPPAIGRDQAFPMQLGVGSFGILPSITFNHYFRSHWSWGAQAKASVFFDENSEGYTPGNSYTATTWLARKIHKNVSISARTEIKAWSEVEGVQTNGLFTLNPTLSSPADPSNTGGHKIDAFIGLNYLHKSGARLALEFGKTIDQDLDGVQLGSDWSWTAGYQLAW